MRAVTGQPLLMWAARVWCNGVVKGLPPALVASGFEEVWASLGKLCGSLADSDGRPAGLRWAPFGSGRIPRAAWEAGFAGRPCGSGA
jgi:hypothetical protein